MAKARSKFSLVLDWLFDQFIYPIFAEQVEEQRVTERSRAVLNEATAQHSVNEDPQYGKIHIDVNSIGDEVTAVWFGCLNLPFQVFRRPQYTTVINPDNFHIDGIETSDRK